MGGFGGVQVRLGGFWGGYPGVLQGSSGVSRCIFGLSWGVWGVFGGVQPRFGVPELPPAPPERVQCPAQGPAALEGEPLAQTCEEEEEEGAPGQGQRWGPRIWGQGEPKIGEESGKGRGLERGNLGRGHFGV